MYIHTHVTKAAELEPSLCEDNTHTHAQLNLREKTVMKKHVKTIWKIYENVMKTVWKKREKSMKKSDKTVAKGNCSVLARSFSLVHFFHSVCARSVLVSE